MKRKKPYLIYTNPHISPRDDIGGHLVINSYMTGLVLACAIAGVTIAFWSSLWLSNHR